MENFIRFLLLLVVLLTVCVVFKDSIIFSAKELYYVWKEDKTQQVDDRNYEEDVKNEKYWSGKTFLLDVYATDLGYVPAIKELEPELVNGEKLAIWRCGKRRFSVDHKEDTFIGIVGDRWYDLATITDYTDNGFSIRFDDVTLNNVDEETVVYVVSTVLNLRKSDNLRDASDGIRHDLEDYRTNKKGVLE